MEFKEILTKVLGEVEGLDTLADTLNKEVAKSYMPRNKFNEINEELKATKSEIESMNAKVQEFSKNSTLTEELKTQLEDANKKYAEFESQTTTRELNLTKRHALDKALREANANADTVDMLVDKFNLESIVLSKENKIVDWETHLSPIKEQRKSLFGEHVTQGNEPSKGNNSNVDTSTLSDTEYFKLQTTK